MMLVQARPRLDSGVRPHAASGFCIYGKCVYCLQSVFPDSLGKERPKGSGLLFPGLDHAGVFGCGTVSEWIFNAIYRVQSTDALALLGYLQSRCSMTLLLWRPRLMSAAKKSFSRFGCFSPAPLIRTSSWANCLRHYRKMWLPTMR